MGLDAKNVPVNKVLEKVSLEVSSTLAFSEKEKVQEQVKSQDTLEVQSHSRELDPQEAQESVAPEKDTEAKPQETSWVEREHIKPVHEVAQASASSEMNTEDDGEEEGAAAAVKIKAFESGQDSARLPSLAAPTYAIQCNNCFKWRIMPSKEKYEAVGECILEKPFLCAQAREWLGSVSCNDPTDLDEDKPGAIWAFDKCNMPSTPKGFHRHVVLRAQGSRKFADVYYRSPCGRSLRSRVEVQKYLEDYPELTTTIDQFCFTCPRRTNIPASSPSTKRRNKETATLRNERYKELKIGNSEVVHDPFHSGVRGGPRSRSR